VAREWPGGVVLARSRKLAAIVAIVVPAPCLFMVFAALTKKGLTLEHLLTHSLLMTLLGPGLAAIAFWIWRYFRPAVRALGDSRPIFLEDGHLVIQGHRFPLGERMVLRYDQSVAEVVANDRVLGRFPSYFMRLRPPEPGASA
jgi:hypothetical protein